MLKSLIKEYGLIWVINRFFYKTKLTMLKCLPVTEFFFEKNVNIRRVDIFDINIQKIELFLKKLSDIKKNEIIKIADRAIEGKFQVFSSIELDYGNPINWHLNPITGVEINQNIKWYKIQDFDINRGDIKVIWEASRFTHFFYLARAYMITKDKKYYYSFSKQLEHWIKNNTYSFGVNYKCGQEAAIRMINAIIVYSVFKAYGLIEERDETNIKELIKGSYKKVLSNFFYAYKCIKNNHTLSEITGLIIGAWCSENVSALRKAYYLLEKEINYQFKKDGGYIQNSFTYQRLALQLMEFIIKISKKTGFKLSDNSISLIKKSALFIYQLQDETGDVPNYGSNDGALIFHTTACDYRDFRPVINTIYVLIKGERLYKPGIYDEEILWFSDYKLEDLTYTPIAKKPVAFKDTGLYSLRHENGFLMIILHNYKTRPYQMDQMHIDLWHKGINVLCDCGTYSYALDIGMKMALTAAHNTVSVDNKEQMKKHGPFLIYDWTRAVDIEYADNRFKGTMISKNGYSHTREIIQYSDGYVIKDVVEGNFNDIKVLFHTPCEVRQREYGLDLVYNNALIAKFLTNDEIYIEESYRSLYYMKKERINLILTKNSNGNNFQVKIILN